MVYESLVPWRRRLILKQYMSVSVISMTLYLTIIISEEIAV